KPSDAWLPVRKHSTRRRSFSSALRVSGLLVAPSESRGMSLSPEDNEEQAIFEESTLRMVSPFQSQERWRQPSRPTSAWRRRLYVFASMRSTENCITFNFSLLPL